MRCPRNPLSGLDIRETLKTQVAFFDRVTGSRRWHANAQTQGLGIWTCFLT